MCVEQAGPNVLVGRESDLHCFAVEFFGASWIAHVCPLEVGRLPACIELSGRYPRFISRGDGFLEEFAGRVEFSSDGGIVGDIPGGDGIRAKVESVCKVACLLVVCNRLVKTSDLVQVISHID